MFDLASSKSTIAIVRAPIKGMHALNKSVHIIKHRYAFVVVDIEQHERCFLQCILLGR